LHAATGIAPVPTSTADAPGMLVWHSAQAIARWSPWWKSPPVGSGVVFSPPVGPANTVVSFVA
jgi:hypothetical protein